MVVPLAWSRALEIVKLDSPCDVDHAGLVLAAGEVAGFLGGPPRAGPVGVLAEEEERSVDRGVPTTSFGVKHLTPSKSSYTAIVDQSRLDFVARLCSTRYPIATSMSSAMLLLVLWIGIPRELIKYLRNNELPIPSH